MNVFLCHLYNLDEIKIILKCISLVFDILRCPLFPAPIKSLWALMMINLYSILYIIINLLYCLPSYYIF